MSKADKARLPKSIGGVKIPKSLRGAGWLDEIVARPDGRALIAEAIMKAAEAAVAVLLAERPDAEPGEETDPTGIDAPMAEVLPDVGDSIAVAPPRPPGRRRKPDVDPATGEPDQAASAGS